MDESLDGDGADVRGAMPSDHHGAAGGGGRVARGGGRGGRHGMGTRGRGRFGATLRARGVRVESRHRRGGGRVARVDGMRSRGVESGVVADDATSRAVERRDVVGVGSVRPRGRGRGSGDVEMFGRRDDESVFSAMGRSIRFGRRGRAGGGSATDGRVRRNIESVATRSVASRRAGISFYDERIFDIRRTMRVRHGRGRGGARDGSAGRFRIERSRVRVVRGIFGRGSSVARAKRDATAFVVVDVGRAVGGVAKARSRRERRERRERDARRRLGVVRVWFAQHGRVHARARFSNDGSRDERCKNTNFYRWTGRIASDGSERSSGFVRRDRSRDRSETRMLLERDGDGSGIGDASSRRVASPPRTRVDGGRRCFFLFHFCRFLFFIVLRVSGNVETTPSRRVDEHRVARCGEKVHRVVSRGELWT